MEDEQEHPLNEVSLVLNTATEGKQLMYREDAITRTRSKLCGFPEAVSNWFRNVLGYKLLCHSVKKKRSERQARHFQHVQGFLLRPLPFLYRPSRNCNYPNRDLGTS